MQRTTRGLSVFAVLVGALLFAGTPISAGMDDSTSSTQRDRETVRRLFERYGGPRFSEVEWLQYTFHVRVGERVADRSWTWRPATNVVQYRDGQDSVGSRPVVFNHREVSANPYADSTLRQADHRFVNDNYWFLFPLQIAWDPTVGVTYDGAQPLPMGEGAAERITVSYPAEGGYTPGDAYRLYYDETYTVRQWEYLRGGDPAHARPARWSEPVAAGPLRLTLGFANADSSFRLWFSEVRLKLSGQPQPILVVE